MTDPTPPQAKAKPTTPPRLPRLGDVVMCYPNGDTKRNGYVGHVTRVFGTGGDPAVVLNVAAFTPEAKPHAFTSIYHKSKAASGQPCWDWPSD